MYFMSHYACFEILKLETSLMKCIPHVLTRLAFPFKTKFQNSYLVISGLDFGQNQLSSSLQSSHNSYSTEQSQGLNQMGGLDQSVGISTTSDVPPSIPLPNQASLNPNVLNADSQNGMTMADVSIEIFHN